MVTLSNIRGRVKSDLAITSTEYDTQIDDSIRSAIRFNEGKPFYFLEKNDDITLLESSSSVALPSDFSGVKKKGFKLLYNGHYLGDGDGFDKIAWDDLNNLYRSNLTDGTPRRCAILGTSLYVDVTADSDYTINVTYYKKDTTLPTADGQTSVMFEEAQDVIYSRAKQLFKMNAENFDATPNDSALADFYYNELVKRAGRWKVN